MRRFVLQASKCCDTAIHLKMALGNANSRIQISSTRGANSTLKVDIKQLTDTAIRNVVQYLRCSMTRTRLQSLKGILEFR